MFEAPPPGALKYVIGGFVEIKESDSRPHALIKCAVILRALLPREKKI